MFDYFLASVQMFDNTSLHLSVYQSACFNDNGTSPLDGAIPKGPHAKQLKLFRLKMSKMVYIIARRNGESRSGF